MHDLCSVLQMNTDNEGILERAPSIQLLPAVGLQRISIQANLVNNNLLNSSDAANETTFHLKRYRS
jgi:hypothetical protein